MPPEIDASGRLLAYEPSTRVTSEVLRGLNYANGVAVSADQSFVAAGRAFFGIDGASKPASTDSELERTATHRNFHAAFNAGEAQEEISSWGGLDFGIHLRVVCFVGLTAWCLGFVAPYKDEALLAFIVLSAVTAYSAFALCYYDALGAAWHRRTA